MSCPACPRLHPRQVICADSEQVDSTLLQGWILPQRAAAAWTQYYSDTAKFIRTHKQDRRIKIVEIGTAYGGLADALLAALPRADLVAVDPFIGGYDVLDATSHMYAQLGDNVSAAWATALAHELSLKHPCRYALLHDNSRAAAPSFADGSVDVLFIDGLHTYSGVAGDLRAWWPKMHPHGLVIMNDMPNINFLDVTRAALAALDFFAWRPLPRLSLGSEGTPPGAGNAALILAEQDVAHQGWDYLQRLLAKWPAPPGAAHSATFGLLLAQYRCLTTSCRARIGGGWGARMIWHQPGTGLASTLTQPAVAPQRAGGAVTQL